MKCLLGIDDTDSALGRCTTHLGFQIVNALLEDGCVFRTYPRLVRLNPNVPFKTRGNAAVCLEFDSDDPAASFETASSLLAREADVDNGANSGLVLVEGEPSRFFRDLYAAALSRLVNHRKTASALRQAGAKHLTLGNGMGLVGAASSIGFEPAADHTYEVISYRRPESFGKPRRVDDSSVVSMTLAMFPHTFNDYDHESRRILITPHGPDPVFSGVRADSPAAALEAYAMVVHSERLAGHIIYLSNQHTDAHLKSELRIPLSAYSSGWVEGFVSRVGKGEGGHVYIDLETGRGQVRSAVYEPSGDLRRVSALLRSGDRIRISGGVRRRSSRHPPVVNVERLWVLSVAPVADYSNPVCSRCGVSAKSEGVNKGFQCRRCGQRFSSDSRTLSFAGRGLVPGVYLPSPRAQRHLTKQLVRYGNEASQPSPLVAGWLERYPDEAASPDGAELEIAREGFEPSICGL